jgi:DNA polymerase
MDAKRAHRITLQDAEALEMLGVDFVPTAAPSAGSTPKAPPPAPPPARAAPDDDIWFALNTDEPRRSRRRAGAAATPSARRQALLDAIRDRYVADEPHKAFPTDHTSIVFGDGDPCARLMFIGEAPGADEDREGVPFVGRAGQLLNQMIAAMGLARERVYICNVLKVRPPNNATPTPEQAALCAPYLYDQIRVIAPEVIVTLGRPATQLLLERTDAMAAMRGHWWEFPPPGAACATGFTRPIPVMPTYHPAFLLRQNTVDNRRKVWSDLKLVMERLGLPEPARGG